MNDTTKGATVAGVAMMMVVSGMIYHIVDLSNSCEREFEVTFEPYYEHSLPDMTIEYTCDPGIDCIKYGEYGLTDENGTKYYVTGHYVCTSYADAVAKCTGKELLLDCNGG